MKEMRQFIFIAGMLVGFAARAEERVYVPAQDVFSPVVTKKVEKSEVPRKALLDPTLTKHRGSELPASKPKVAKPKPVSRSKKLRFSRVNINGGMAQPRVSFERDMLRLDIYEEEQPKDFYDRIFATSEERLRP